MLKKSITYTDFNGNEVTEEFHFHLSKAELLEMEASTRGGLGNYLQQIVDSNDGGAIIQAFKDLLLKSIGKISEDGKRFEKSASIEDDFMQSPAYSELFIQLATDAGAAAEFVNGIIPQGLSEDVAKIGEVPAPPQRKAEQVETPPKKVISKEEASKMGRDELFQRMTQGWQIEE